MLKKAKQLKTNKPIKLGNPQHLASFDSMQKPRGKHTHSVHDSDGFGLYK